MLTMTMTMAMTMAMTMMMRMTMTLFCGELRYDCRSHEGVQPNIGAWYQVKWDEADDHNHDVDDDLVMVIF